MLDWYDASGETGYRVERSLTGLDNTWVAVGNYGANVPLHVESGLVSGTQYFYRIVTLDAAGVSAISNVVSPFTRLADVTNLQFTTKTSTQMAISWSAVSGASGYLLERSTDNETWTTISTNQPTRTYTDNNVVPMGEYYYRVTAVNGTNTSINPVTIFAAAPPLAANSIPSPWQQRDVGSVGGTGASSFNSGIFTIIGSGSDIWTTADQFRFVYLTLPGNGSIQARVASIEADEDWTWAGVMVRATSGTSTATGSKYAAMMISPNHNSYSQSRLSTDGTSTQTEGPEAVALRGLKSSELSREVPSILTMSVSTNGTTWTQVGTPVTLTNMSGNVRIGLVVSAVDNTDLDRVTFDQVVVTGVSGVSAAPDENAFASASSTSDSSSKTAGNSSAKNSVALGISSFVATLNSIVKTPVVANQIAQPRNWPTLWRIQTIE